MRYVCSICGYVYDEAKERRPFADLPADWTCPWCGAVKAAFRPEQAEAPAPAAAPAAELPDGEGFAAAGVRAAVCSNLGRGCEKQYDGESAALYRRIAAWFTAAAPAEAGGLAELEALLAADLERGYPALRAAAQAVGDRGTQRICVWGEKVTAILRSLLQRWQREGEALTDGTEVWVCSVCGFVYVGDEVPALCPVCKVPAWKFDRVEGRAGA